MQDYQKDFIDFVLSTNVLQFGEFTLKSGRISPYFFNSGLFSSGKHLSQLGKSYAMTIKDSKINFNAMFGPAYKGVPLVVATVLAFNNSFNRDIFYSFNRKEVKDHGEGGSIVGHALKKGDNVLIIDDVITSGIAIEDSINFIQKRGAKVSGIIVAFDRQEKGQNKNTSSSYEVEQKFGVKVFSIIKLEHIISYLEQHLGQDIDNNSLITKFLNYRATYGA